MPGQNRVTGQIFISFCEEDDGIATQLSASLEAAGYRAWYYTRDSLPGISYLAQTAEAIQNAKIFILIISPRSLSCRQMTREVERAHEEGLDFIPILVDMTHVQFQQQGRIEWREAVGTAVSIRLESGNVQAIMPRILAALKNMGHSAMGVPAAARRQAAAGPAIFKIGRCNHSNWETCGSRKNCGADGPEDCGNHVILFDSADMKSHSRDGRLLPGCSSISRRSADLLLYPARACIRAKKGNVCLNSEMATLPAGVETELKHGDWLCFKASGCSSSKWQCAIARQEDGHIREVRLVHLAGIAGCAENGTENAAKEYVFTPSKQPCRDR